LRQPQDARPLLCHSSAQSGWKAGANKISPESNRLRFSVNAVNGVSFLAVDMSIQLFFITNSCLFNNTFRRQNHLTTARTGTAKKTNAAMISQFASLLFWCQPVPSVPKMNF
jgi:hypothetical protein